MVTQKIINKNIVKERNKIFLVEMVSNQNKGAPNIKIGMKTT